MSFLKFFYRLLREQKLKFLIVAVLMALVALTEGLIIALIVPLLNLVMGENATQEGFLGRFAIFVENIFHFFHIELSLSIILIIIVVIFVLQGILRLLQMHAQMRMQVQYQFSLIHDLFTTLLYSSWPFILKSKIGHLVNVLYIETGRATAAFQFCCTFLASLFIAAFYIVLASLISWKITLVGIILCSFASLTLKRLMKQAEGYGINTTKANNELQAYAYDKLAAAKMIKCSTTEQKAVADMDTLTKRVVQLRYLSMMNSSAIGCIYQPLVMGILAFLAYLAVTYGHADLTMVFVFIYIFMRLAPQFSALQGSYQQALIFMPGLEEIDKLTEQVRKNSELGGDKKIERFGETTIVFDNVNFAYDNSSFVLENINMEIKKGESVAIVGESGAGKTTLVDLLMGLLTPTSGQILIAGTPLGDYNLTSWRKSIGYISQDIFLFHDTIEANLRWIASDVSNEKIRAAAKVAYADDFIAEMPEGYNTIIGDRGFRLSGGQRQRLTLARIILQDPQIIILDEATSALDSESEVKVQQAIDRVSEGKTMITIAHRLSTVRNADRIYVLKGGSFVEVGKWEELAAQGGYFSHLLELSMQGRTEEKEV